MKTLALVLLLSFTPAAVMAKSAKSAKAKAKTVRPMTPPVAIEPPPLFFFALPYSHYPLA